MASSPGRVPLDEPHGVIGAAATVGAQTVDRPWRCSVRRGLGLGDQRLLVVGVPFEDLAGATSRCGSASSCTNTSPSPPAP